MPYGQHHLTRNAGNTIPLVTRATPSPSQRGQQKKWVVPVGTTHLTVIYINYLLQLLDVDSNLNNSGLLDNLGETAQYRLHH